MNRRKSKKKSQKYDNYKETFGTKLLLYHYMKYSTMCRQQLPISCHFCKHIEQNDYGLLRHLTSSPQYAHIINKKRLFQESYLTYL